MRLFGRSGGYWLFWVSVMYVLAGIINWYVVPCTRMEYIQAAYVWLLVYHYGFHRWLVG